MPHCAQCSAHVERPGDVCGACAATVILGTSAHAPAPTFTGPLPVGAVLAEKWRIEGVLGHGGMGVVLLAHDRALGRKVAVKFLAEHLCLQPDFVERFQREAQLTARLVHPNIVHVYDVGQHAGRPFLVMQHLEGLPLSHYLRSQPCELKASEVLAIARQLCAGLEFIHSRGFVHRDLKPGNLFIAADGHLTLLDFGVLKPFTVDDSTAGSMIGTVPYMSPEQLRGEPADARSDVFAAAIVLSEVAGGCRAASDLAQKAPWVPAPVRDVLARGMAASADARFASATELLAALEHAYASASATPSLPSIGSISGSTRRGRRRLGALVLASGTLVAIAGAVLFASTTPTTPTVSTQPVRVSDATERLPSRTSNSPLPGEARTDEPVKVLPAPVEPVPERQVTRARAAKPSRKKTAATTGTLRIVTLLEDEVTWAHVHINGTAHGESPVTLKLPVGVHALRVERPGFRAIQRTVRVSADERALVRLELKP